MKDERGLVGKSAVTIMVLIVVVGLAAIDGGSIFFATLQLSDPADAAASAAEQTYASSHNIIQARQAAITAAHDQDTGAHVTKVSVAPGGAGPGTRPQRASTPIPPPLGLLKKYAPGTTRPTSSPR